MISTIKVMLNVVVSLLALGRSASSSPWTSDAFVPSPVRVRRRGQGGRHPAKGQLFLRAHSNENDNQERRQAPVHVQKTSSSTSTPSFSKASSLQPLSLDFSNSPEWHDAFLRNGFGDFVPSICGDNPISCLVMTGPSTTAHLDSTTSDVWIQEQIEAMRPPSLTPNEQGANTQEDNSMQDTERMPSLVEMAEHRQPQQRSIPPIRSLRDGTYECILDCGLMEAILMMAGLGLSPSTVARESGNGNEQQENGSGLTARVAGSADTAASSIRQQVLQDNVLPTSTTAALVALLQEASTVLQEHGIFVVSMRSNLLTPAVKDYLQSMGRILGLDWTFGLDGISNDADLDGVSVSVARRFFTETLSYARPSLSLVRTVPAAMLLTDDEVHSKRKSKKLPPGDSTGFSP